MRWTLTSPDGIGDFLLRVPWLFEMERHGWQLQLVARSPTLEAARLVGLSGDFVPLQQSPYSKAAKLCRNPFRAELQVIRRHRPGLVFLGPSHPTFFEEEAAVRLSETPLAGFVLGEDFWPSEGLEDPRLIAAKLSQSVAIRDSDNEAARNRLAAETLLGRKLSLEPLRINATDCGRLPAGLPQRFLCVSPGYREGDYFTGWGSENWVRELRELEASCGLPFVFTGSAGEGKSNSSILESLARPSRHINLTGTLLSLSELVAVVAAAEAYVGKDSGAMHLAGAVGTPVLAVFGGGHRHRFFPVRGPAVVLTVAASCRGCDWRCHLPEPVCVRGLMPGILVEGWNALSAQVGEEVIAVEQQPGPEIMKILSTHPQNLHPVVAHEIRKREFRALRKQALRPLPFRLWRRLTRSRKTGLQAGEEIQK